MKISKQTNSERIQLRIKRVKKKKAKPKNSAEDRQQHIQFFIRGLQFNFEKGQCSQMSFVH